jgi:hypothetical protein
MHYHLWVDFSFNGGKDNNWKLSPNVKDRQHQDAFRAMDFQKPW